MNENEVKKFLAHIGITYSGSISENDSYVIDLPNSDAYGKVFSTLDSSDDLEIMQDNQVITEQGSSLMYECEEEPYLLNLIADFDSDLYQLVVNGVE